MTSEHKPARWQRILALFIIAAVATAAGIWSARQLLQHQGKVDELAMTRFPEAREIEAFELIDHDSRPFNNASLRDRWSFLFFGYTHCPDVCPTTLAVLNSVAQQLQDSDTEVRFIFVSVDPERDTPEQLARYVTYFNGEFVGVTGTPAGIEQLTKQLGIMYLQVADEASPASYLIDHTAGVFLFDPDGRYHAVFTPPLSAGDMASAFRRMAEDFS